MAKPGQEIHPVFQCSFRPLYGKPCWNVRPGYANSLTLEFGEPQLEIIEPHVPEGRVSRRVRALLAQRNVTVRGEWHLWIWACDWRIYKGRKLLATSEAKKKAVSEAAAFLDGQALTRAEFHWRGCRSEFTFDLGGRLVTRPLDATSEQWLLYEPSGKVLVLRADKTYSHRPANTKAGIERLRPAWSR